MLKLIVKLQRPIDPPDAEWLASDESHSFESPIRAKDVPDAIRTAMADDLKGYFEGEIQADGCVKIRRRVPDQRW